MQDKIDYYYVDISSAKLDYLQLRRYTSSDVCVYRLLLATSRFELTSQIASERNNVRA